MYTVCTSGLIGTKVIHANCLELRGHIMPHSSSFVFRKQILNFFPTVGPERFGSSSGVAAFARICYFFGLVKNMMLMCDTSSFRPIESFMIHRTLSHNIQGGNCKSMLL